MRQHAFTSELPEYTSFADYAKSKLTGGDLEYFIAGLENPNLPEEYHVLYAPTYVAWLNEFKITHTISEDGAVVSVNNYADF